MVIIAQQQEYNKVNLRAKNEDICIKALYTYWGKPCTLIVIAKGSYVKGNVYSRGLSPYRAAAQRWLAIRSRSSATGH